jgi:hypothetical protein
VTTSWLVKRKDMKEGKLREVLIALAGVVALATALLAFVPIAVASPPQPVTITVDTTIAEGAVDPFTATGDVICASGEVSNLKSRFVGSQSGTHARIIVVKHFVCDDGSGTFDILVRATLDFATFDTVGTWSVLRGTGAYAKLHGTGSLAGENLGPDVVRDVYTGSMHVD